MEKLNLWKEDDPDLEWFFDTIKDTATAENKLLTANETRDFGNENDDWTDQILTDYFVLDLVNSYKLFNGYKIQVGINNILDEKYQQAHEYSTMGRAFNFGLKKVH